MKQADEWFKQADEALEEYQRFCKIIKEDLQNPGIPEIIKSYLVDLNNKIKQNKGE
jgi:hypothetical protein